MSAEIKRYSLHASIGYQSTLTSRVFERRLEECLRPIGLTRLNWCILLAVVEERLSSPSDIADFVGIDRTATSRALRHMEKDGLIERGTGRNDRRRTVVTATQKARDMLDEAVPAANANAKHFANKLSESERETLRALLIRMREGEDAFLSNF